MEIAFKCHITSAPISLRRKKTRLRGTSLRSAPWPGVICASMGFRSHPFIPIYLLMLGGCASLNQVSSGCRSVDPSWNNPLTQEHSEHLNEIEILSNDKNSLEIISKARRIYWYRKNERDYLVCVRGDRNGCGDFLFPLEKIDNVFLMASLTEITVC